MDSQMTRREFLRTAAATTATVALGRWADGSADPEHKPNLVFVFADQMRAQAMGCMGNTQVLTPHLDKLAKQGILFTDAISCQPVCTPYRAQLMTGRYGHTTGVIHNDIRVPDKERLLPEIMKSHGYTTGYVGKWHLAGYRQNPADATSRRGCTAQPLQGPGEIHGHV